MDVDLDVEMDVEMNVKMDVYIIKQTNLIDKNNTHTLRRANTNGQYIKRV